MRRLTALLITTCVVFASAIVPASSAGAAPPDRFEVDDFIVLYPDLDINRSVFINITARDFCDWLAGGPAGPPPAIDPVPVKVIETGKGALVTSVDAKDLNIEMWEFDEDPSPLIGPCEDIQQQLDDPEAMPWAAGTARYTAHDNDFFRTETRGNSFGDKVSADLTDRYGNHHSYHHVFHLNWRCNQPDFAPPICLVERSKLR